MALNILGRMPHSALQTTVLALSLALYSALGGPVQAADPTWRPVGGTGVAAGLAGPVGDVPEDAWFSADGQRLYVSLRATGIWVSADSGLTWAPAERPDRDLRAGLESSPIQGGSATAVRNPYRAGVSYMLAEHLFRSDDGGRSWTNLTRSPEGTVIGRWQSVLAISPADAELIVVGNSSGLWKSHDAGITWASLNGRLPNFPPVRILDGRKGGAPLLASHLGTLELAWHGPSADWTATSEGGRSPGHVSQAPGLGSAPPGPLLPPGFAATHRIWRDGRAISPDLTGCRPHPDCEGHAVSAMADGGQLWAGTTNGRIWLSEDHGRTWDLVWTDPDGEAVWSIWAVPGGAAAAAVVGTRVLRSSNSGALWVDITADLPSGSWTKVVGHPETGAVYVAGAPGVYASATDLSLPLPPRPWTAIRGNLPSQEIIDLAVDPLRGRLYVALAGHGIRWTHAPRVSRALRALSAADLAERPAAPGSLLTILGIEAQSARADGQAAPVLHASKGRTQLQVPFRVEGRSVRLLLNSPGASHSMDLPLQEVSPAIFVVAGDPLVLDARSGSMVGWARPASPGASVLAMMSGLGAVRPHWPAGVESPRSSPPSPIARLAARVSGLEARVVAANLAPGYVGTYLVEVEIPAAAPPGECSLVISADGLPSNLVPLVVGR